MSEDEQLRLQAEAFAEDLTHTVAALVPGCDAFHAQVLGDRGGGRLVVSQSPDTGVPLKVDEEPLLTLKVSYFCSWDAPERYLAVDRSAIKVYAGPEARGEPLFRYEYERWPYPEMAGAHLQIRAHRDDMTWVMSNTGTGSRRGRARATKGTAPTMRELHFPVGGPRFRPCLEDVLEMLVVELGVDCTPEGRRALVDGRATWRQTQLATATRDNPAGAIDALRELGYTVEWGLDSQQPTGSPHKVRAL